MAGVTLCRHACPKTLGSISSNLATFRIAPSKDAFGHCSSNAVFDWPWPMYSPWYWVARSVASSFGDVLLRRFALFFCFFATSNPFPRHACILFSVTLQITRRGSLVPRLSAKLSVADLRGNARHLLHEGMLCSSAIGMLCSSAWPM